MSGVLQLMARGKSVQVTAERGLTLLEHAIRYKAEWSYMCMRGTCARCRCLVTTGAEYLADITDEEWDRLEPEEFEEGYRLGCQAIVTTDGAEIIAENKTYF